jgi:hypothetical protein
VQGAVHSLQNHSFPFLINLNSAEFTPQQLAWLSWPHSLHVIHLRALPPFLWQMSHTLSLLVVDVDMFD